MGEWSRQGGLVWKGYCNDISSVLKAYDVFVHPSYHEGMSTAVCEAISCGLPVVGTDIPGIQELVQGNGFLVPVRDVESLESALEKMLMCSDDEMAAMARISRNIAEAKFDRYTVMKRIEEVIT
jgi:galacturonosyltransferase